MRLAIIFAVVSLLISSCSWMPFVDSDADAKAEKAKQEELKQLTEKGFYDRIQRNLKARNWTEAISNLQGFEAQFPFGNYAEQAQLELIYVYLESQDHEAAVASADRFILIPFATKCKTSSSREVRALSCARLGVESTGSSLSISRRASHGASLMIAKTPRCPNASSSKGNIVVSTRESALN